MPRVGTHNSIYSLFARATAEPGIVDPVAERAMHTMTIVIRRAEPSDYEAVRAVFAGAHAIWGTLQLPFPSAEQWRKRLAEPAEGLFSLVACVDDQVIGQLGLH